MRSPLASKDYQGENRPASDDGVSVPLQAEQHAQASPQCTV